MFIMGKTKPRRRKIDVCKVQCPKEGRPTPPRLPPPEEVRDLLQRIREVGMAFNCPTFVNQVLESDQ